MQTATTVKATITNYFDVWGNRKDGYEVNNLCKHGDIELPENFENIDLLRAMKQANFLQSHVRLNMLIVEDLYPYYEISQRSTGLPLGRIEIEETPGED